MPGDVFEKDPFESVSEFAGDTGDVRPEVALVGFSVAAPGEAEGLAIVNDGSVCDVAFVFVDGNIENVSDAAGFVPSDALPSIAAINSAGSISIWNSEDELLSLPNNSPLNFSRWRD